MARAFEVNVNSAWIALARIAQIMPFAFAITTTVDHALAQDAFRSPLLGQAAALASNSLSFSQIDIAPSIAGCKGLLSLREEAERRIQLIKVAADKASPDEKCMLLRNFSQTEIKMIEKIEAHSTNCSIPPRVEQTLKVGRKTTETARITLCREARAQRKGGLSLNEVLESPRREPGGSVGDFGIFR